MSAPSSTPTPTPAPDPAPTPAPAPPEPAAYTAPATQADLDRIISNRLNQERAKLGGLSADDVADLRTKADELATLKAAQGSDMDRAVAAAKDAATKEADARWAPLLTRSAIETAAVGRIGSEELGKALEFTDLSKFLTRGQVDTTKVSAFVDSIAAQQPATPTPGGRAPVFTPHNPGGAPPVAFGSQGQAMAEKRFGKKP